MHIDCPILTVIPTVSCSPIWWVSNCTLSHLEQSGAVLIVSVGKPCSRANHMLRGWQILYSCSNAGDIVFVQFSV